MLEARNTPTNFTFQEDKSVCQQITPIYLPQKTPINPLPTSIPQPAEVDLRALRFVSIRAIRG